MRILVFDIGGTFIKYALMDNQARMYHKSQVLTPQQSLSALLDVIEEIYHSFDEKLQGIALSMPGNINAQTGHIDTPGALFYNHNVNIIKAIQDRININVSVENDGKCAGLAEVWQGNLVDCQSGIVLVLGSGIGGAIIHNRQVLKGNHFFAGEVSFLMTNDNEFDFANALAAKASTMALVNQVSKLKNQTLDGYQVFDLIYKKDEETIQAFDKMTTSLAIQIYNLQCLLDPEKILIGGGISRQPILIETISKKLQDYYKQLPFPIPQAKLETCKFYADSNLLGAMYHFLSKYHHN